MTITATAPITLANVMAELRTVTPGRAYPISLGDADVRALAGVPSGPISLNNLLGKSAYTAMSGTMNDQVDSATIAPGGDYTKSVAVSLSLAGGQAPFSYAWEKVSGVGTVTEVNAASTTANFNISRFAQPETELTQVVRCTVTDNTGATLVRTATVTVFLN